MSKHPKSIVNLIPERIFQEVHQLSFGDIYFLENTIVTELNEGINFGWEYGSEIIPLAEKHFGRQFFINYVSNRIYDYSVIAQDWRKFFDQNRKLKNFCIVTPGNTGVANIAIERVFYKDGQIINFTDLMEALKFTGNID